MSFPLKTPKEPPATTTVFDTGRRGNPMIGCDCVQCFGYCSLSPDIRERELRVTLEAALTGKVTI